MAQIPNQITAWTIRLTTGSETISHPVHAHTHPCWCTHTEEHAHKYTLSHSHTVTQPHRHTHTPHHQCVPLPLTEHDWRVSGEQWGARPHQATSARPRPHVPEPALSG